MYAATVISSTGKSIPVGITLENSFRRLRIFVERKLATGELQEQIRSIELEGFEPGFADMVVITTARKNNAGHQRMTFSI